MKALFLFIYLSFMSLGLSAQVLSGLDAQNNLNDIGGQGVTVREIAPIKGNTQGSPYLSEAFLKGILVLSNGETFNTELNLDLMKGVIYAKSQRGILMLEASKVDTIKIIDKEVERIFLPSYGIKLGCESCLIEYLGEYKGQFFYGRENVLFEPAQVGGAYNAGKDYDRYLRKLEVATLVNGEASSLNKLNNKWLKEVLGDDFKAFKSIEKSQNLDSNDPLAFKKMLLML
ncbi:hypothetical protein [Penaeicola halotolerans]|uniref:hypothetical protein n=1 Tax=Penaeicola halotolerans TaxID=2793196 RepID=UPI001CF8DDB3|nr:hypothetical protein [Penaeicola halotolerans]